MNYLDRSSPPFVQTQPLAIRTVDTAKINELVSACLEVLRENVDACVAACSICPFRPVPSKITLWLNSEGKLSALDGLDGYRKILDQTLIPEDSLRFYDGKWDKKLKELGLYQVRLDFHVYDKVEDDRFFELDATSPYLPPQLHKLTTDLFFALNKMGQAAQEKARQDSIPFGRDHENPWFFVFSDPAKYSTHMLTQ